jgi:signal transduction histidine kinase
VQGAANAWPFYLWTGLLLLFNSTMVLLVRSEHPEIYLLYLPVVLFAAATLAPWALLSTIGLALLGYVGSVWLSESDLETGELALRGVVLLVVGLLGAYLAAEQRREVTERARREAQDLEQSRDLSIMISTGEMASRSLDPDVMLIDVLSTLLELTDLRGAAVFVADAAGRELTLRVSRGEVSDGAAEGIEIATRAVQNRRPVSHRLHPAPGPGTDKVDDGETWMVSVPLLAKSRTVGALALTFPPGVLPAPSEIEFLGAVGNQLGVALENALLYEELQQKERLRGELLAKVISAEEEERKRIARELHDEAIQSLSTVLVQLGAIEEGLRPRAKTRERIAEVRGLMMGAINEVRKAILGLRPSALDDLGLVPALRSFTTERLEEAGVTLHWDATGLRRRLPQEMETALFRIVQEAVTNVVRHAGAETVRIELWEEDGRVIAEVEDDGVGFDIARFRRQRPGEGGLGLVGMRERASLFGGTMEAQSAPEQGTRLHFELPLQDKGRVGP